MIDLDLLYQKLRSFCCRAERSPWDIHQWLHKKNIFDKDIIESLLSRLKKENLVNENRFIRAFASDKLRFSYWGYYKIRNELLKRNFSEEMIETSLSKVLEEEKADDILLYLITKRFENINLNTLSEEERQKHIRYFYVKGFPLDSIITMIDLYENKAAE